MGPLGQGGRGGLVGGRAVGRQVVGEQVVGRVAGLVPARPVEVVVQVVGGVAEAAQEASVDGERGQPLRGDRAQQSDRITAGALPDLRIDRAEQLARLRMPGPAQVERQLTEGSEGFGQDGTDRKTSNCLHLMEDSVLLRHCVGTPAGRRGN